MTDSEASSKVLAQAATKTFEVLSPLTSEQRLRVVRSALELLGETATSIAAATNSQPAKKPDEKGQDGISRPAQIWIEKSGVTLETLEQYFDIRDDSTEVIGLPQSVTKVHEKVLMTYLFTGLSKLISSGESTFSDEEARERCKHFGCYDHTNHSKYLKAFANRITGSKNAGWKVTAPGLNEIAQKIRP